MGPAAGGGMLQRMATLGGAPSHCNRAWLGAWATVLHVLPIFMSSAVVARLWSSEFLCTCWVGQVRERSAVWSVDRLLLFCGGDADS